MSFQETFFRLPKSGLAYMTFLFRQLELFLQAF